MKRITILSLFVALLFPLAYCQTGKVKPQWAANPVHAEGKTSKLITINEYGLTKESATARAFKTLEEQGYKLNEGYRIIEEYWEYTNEWAYGYFLVQVSNTPKCGDWEHIEMNTTKYPFSGRVFVPGMAQIYKGSKAKGGVIIGLETLGIGGIVTSFCMKSSYESLMQQDKKNKADYSNKADTWLNVGYGCIAFAAAVYIYNIIDGAVAPGKKHIQIGSKSYDYAIAPMVTTRGDVGLAARITF